MLIQTSVFVLAACEFCSCKYSSSFDEFISSNDKWDSETSFHSFESARSSHKTHEKFYDSKKKQTEYRDEPLLDKKARHLLDVLNEKYTNLGFRYQKALWRYKTEMTDKNLQGLKYFQIQYRQLRRKSREDVQRFLIDDLNNYQLKRQLLLYSDIGEDILDNNEWKEYHKIKNDLINYFKNIRVPHVSNSTRNVSFAEIQDELKRSKALGLRRYYWMNFYSHFTEDIKKQYMRLIELVNLASFLHGYGSSVKYTFRDFLNSNVDVVMDLLYRKTKTLYRHLHAYVRQKLRNIFGFRSISHEGHIPLHIIGDLHGKNWVHLYEETKPYPNEEEFNMTQYLLDHNFTVVKMAKLAESFYTSMYLKPLPQKFWKTSYFEKPPIRLFAKRFDCTPESMDLLKNSDYRLKMCGKVDEETLDELYYQMGILQYMLQYQDQPYIFRQPPMKAFLEAVALLPSLTVNGLTYRYKMGYIKQPTYEQLINYLYKLALDKIVYIQYAYATDVYRWNLLNGTIEPEDSNVQYWRLRRYYTGVGPATYRTERTFDAAGNYDIISENYLSKHFLGIYLAFGLHDGLCKVSSHYQNIDDSETFEVANCDLYGEKTSGAFLETGLRIGSAASWNRISILITKHHQIKAFPLINFFKPLFTFLQNSNRATRERISWM